MSNDDDDDDDVDDDDGDGNVGEIQGAEPGQLEPAAAAVMAAMQGALGMGQDVQMPDQEMIQQALPQMVLQFEQFMQQQGQGQGPGQGPGPGQGQWDQDGPPACQQN